MLPANSTAKKGVLFIGTFVASFLLFSSFLHAIRPSERPPAPASAGVSVVTTTKTVEVSPEPETVEQLVVPSGVSEAMHIFPEECIDPYAIPGYLYTPVGRENYRHTVYIPFYHAVTFKAADPPYAQYPWPHATAPELSNRVPEPEYLEVAPHSWMADLVKYNELAGLKAAGGRYDWREHGLLRDRLGFLRDKRVLILGDTVDELLLEYFCAELDVPADVGAPPNTTASCHVGHLNLTVYQWHLTSLYNHQPDWYATDNLVFEDRLERLFRPTLDSVVGMNGRAPDLILFQSALWDQDIYPRRYSNEAPDAHKGSNRYHKTVDRQASWGELRFYIARVRKLLTVLRAEFGENVPIAFRSLSSHKDMDRYDLMILNFDRAARFVSRESGVEVMDWGRLTAGLSGEWFDSVHISKGALSWLFHDMLLNYLFRISGGRQFMGQITRDANASAVAQDKSAPWWECHDTQLAMELVNR